MGTHLIKAWSSTQPNLALSSGEAEVVGVTRACAVALGFRSLLSDLGLQRVTSRVWTDSSAAIGVCKRQGLGKLRHLDTQMLWVQQRVRNNDLDLYYVPGEKNPADIFTKPNIPQARMESLLHCLGCEFQEGRPASAPELRREGGTRVFTVSAHQKPHSQGQSSLKPASEYGNPCLQESPRKYSSLPEGFGIPSSIQIAMGRYC